MKKSLLLAALMLVPVAAQAKPTSGRTSKTSSIVWRTNYDAAMKEAKRTGKPMFIDFYTDWCGWCKVLDEKTYTDAGFIKASRSWVMVKLNAEKGARNIAITKQFQVDGFPYLLMLDGRGKVLNKVVGYAPPKEMLAAMNKAQVANGILSARASSLPASG